MAANPPSGPGRYASIQSIAEQKNDRVVTALAAVFASGGTIGAFFAGFTLNIVVSVDGAKLPQVRLYAAICSLLFVLLVLLCSAGGVVFAYSRDDILAILNKTAPIEIEARWRGWHLWTVFGALPTFLFTILTGGVVFLFLIMREYEEKVALAGLVAVGTGAVCGGLGWVYTLLCYTNADPRKWSWERKDKNAV